VLQSGSGFEWGEVPELGVLAEPGAVVLDFDDPVAQLGEPEAICPLGATWAVRLRLAV